MTRGFRVLILGGGNCGLALATGLKKAGIEYTVFERDSEHDFHHRPRDWGMLLHWGAAYLSKCLPPDMQERLQEIRCDPSLEDDNMGPVPFVNALTGEKVAEIPLTGTNRVSRMKLRKFLTTGQDLDIQFGKTVEHVKVDETQVTVTFRDGTRTNGTMAVGCDGSHSKIREFLVGSQAAKLEVVDLTMMNLPTGGYTADEAQLLQTLHPVFKIATHPTTHGNAILAALDIKNPDDPTTWLFQNYLGWWGPPYAHELKDPTARMDFYKSWVSTFCEPFKTAGMKVLKDGTVLPVYPGQQWAPTMEWNNHHGRVTIAGDAAHSMLPQRGQGLNNAMRDASALVDAITSVARDSTCSLAEAISAYEAEMKPRGAKEVALSFQQAMMSREKNSIKESPLFKQGWKHE